MQQIFLKWVLVWNLSAWCLKVQFCDKKFHNRKVPYWATKPANKIDGFSNIPNFIDSQIWWKKHKIVGSILAVMLCSGRSSSMRRRIHINLCRETTNIILNVIRPVPLFSSSNLWRSFPTEFCILWTNEISKYNYDASSKSFLFLQRNKMNSI